MNRSVRIAEGCGGTIVILSAHCPTCRQQSMPDQFGRCVWCDRIIVDPKRFGTLVA